MKLYKSDKIRFIFGLVFVFIFYTSYYLLIVDNRDTEVLSRKIRHIITFLFTIAVYFIGTLHLGKLKARWMASIWHIVHISGLCIITLIGIIDWFILSDQPHMKLSWLARTIQELLISPVLYVGMGLLNSALNKQKV